MSPEAFLFFFFSDFFIYGSSSFISIIHSFIAHSISSYSSSASRSIMQFIIFSLTNSYSLCTDLFGISHFYYAVLLLGIDIIDIVGGGFFIIAIYLLAMLYFCGAIIAGGGLPEKKFVTELTTLLKNPPVLLDFFCAFLIGIFADF